MPGGGFFPFTFLPMLALVVFVLYILMPPLLLVAISFEPSGFVRPLTGFTFHWYDVMLRTRGLMDALSKSIILAVLTMVITTFLALNAALGYRKTRFKTIVIAIMILPIFLPGLIQGFSLSIVLGQFLGMQRSIWTELAGHVLWALPFAFLVILTSMSVVRRETVLAAMGASLHEAPQAWPSMLAALSRSGTATATAPTSASTKGERGGQAAGDDLPGTAEKLTIAASISKGKEFDEVTVALTVKPGWHINANPASFAYLIPTGIVFDGVKLQSVRYPEAIQFKARFAPTAINVYEGKVRVVAVFAKGVLPRKSSARATLTTQACDDSVCLPPAKIPFSVPSS